MRKYTLNLRKSHTYTLVKFNGPFLGSAGTDASKLVGVHKEGLKQNVITINEFNRTTGGATKASSTQSKATDWNYNQKSPSRSAKTERFHKQDAD